MRAFIIHGAYGDPEENWIPWLKRELKALGFSVIIPHFPTPENQSLASWRTIFAPYMEDISQNTIFIGHSLGPAFILDILEHSDTQVRACFFVSGFLGLLGNNQFDAINKSFTKKRFDWTKICNNCKDFFLFHGSNDPYVPLSKAYELNEKCAGVLQIIDGGGHLNTAAGFVEFSQLLDEVTNLIDK